MSELQALTTAEFEAFVAEPGVAVIDFWAPWCGYCVRMMPVVEEMAAELGDKVRVVKVNADEEGKLAQEMGVEVLPTFIILKDGEIVDRKIGYLPKSELQGAIEAHF